MKLKQAFAGLAAVLLLAACLAAPASAEEHHGYGHHTVSAAAKLCREGRSTCRQARTSQICQRLCAKQLETWETLCAETCRANEDCPTGYCPVEGCPNGENCSDHSGIQANTGYGCGNGYGHGGRHGGGHHGGGCR